MRSQSILKGFLKRYVPWQCYQCGEKSDFGEKKYDRWVTPDGTNEKKEVAVCVHCFNKKDWG